jgi:hypothetical protein
MDAEIALTGKAVGQTLGRVAEAGGEISGNFPGSNSEAAPSLVEIYTHFAKLGGLVIRNG